MKNKNSKLLAFICCLIAIDSYSQIETESITQKVEKYYNVDYYEKLFYIQNK